ncbi:LAMI_0B03928g1_1 [Lachancea mirantina]|uniref:Palmitoyltransferase n=1 Tax=Lachancea mirantina TaxID=1230905 RepID=A0A1G4IV05_9SACH|nr:LAMI_0B03928g1_1 [Lachancea mirantina]
MPSGQVEDTQASLSSLQPIASNTSEIGDEEYTLSQAKSDALPVDQNLENYRQACQNGDLNAIKELLDSGVIDIKHDFYEKERISGLHWASINNRMSIVQYLIQRGADVNFAGGDLNATPLHWASRYGYVYIVDLLMKSGADTTLTDDQGFNVFHLAINSSNIMLVIYLLYFGVGDTIDINSTDSNGRTALLWAAYQGDSLSVKALLDFKADSKICDDSGFSPLHWGTVKGQSMVLQLLMGNGDDVFQKTGDGKDCFTISRELSTVASLEDAMFACGMDQSGHPLKVLFKSKANAKIAIFLCPTIILGLILEFYAHLHIALAVLFSTITATAFFTFLKQFVFTSIGMRKNRDAFLKTPFLSGLLFGTFVWLLYSWFLTVLPVTLSDEMGLNAAFFILFSATIYLFANLLNSDPGSIYNVQNPEGTKTTIKELLRIGKFDARHFCINSYIRKPLRSKYSTFSKSLIARFDHFCPWINNEVGLKNHKHFLLFVVSMEIGLMVLIMLYLEYFDELEDKYESDKNQCLILGKNLCAAYNHDAFSLGLFFWIAFQGCWIMFLLVVQVFQTFKGVTNQEFNDLMKKNGEHTADFSEIFTTTPSELISAEESNLGSEPAELASDPPFSRSFRSRTCFGLCCALTGLDQFLLVFKEYLGVMQSNPASSSARSSRFRIPTDYGWKTNLKDFWLTSDTTAPLWQRLFKAPVSFKALLDGREVDYSTLYALPETQLSIEEAV